MLTLLNRFRLAFGGTIAVIAGIAFGTDPDQLKKSICFVSGGTFCWPKTVADQALSGRLALSPTQASSEPGPLAAGAAGTAAAPAAVETRPTVQVEGSLESELLGSRSLLSVRVKARVTNPGKEPVHVAWANPKNFAQVMLDGTRQLEWSWAYARESKGIAFCRTDANACWSQSGAEFTTIPAGGTAVGTLVFRTGLPTQQLEAAMAAQSFDYIGKLIHVRNGQTVPAKVDIAIERQPLTR